MNAGSADRCARMWTTRGISRPATMSPRCIRPATSSSRIRVMTASHCADDREHRQNHVLDELWRKQPECRTGHDEYGERPSTPSVTESKPPAERRAFARDAQALEHEVPGRQAVRASYGHRYHEFVNQSGD